MSEANKIEAAPDGEVIGLDLGSTHAKMAAFSPGTGEWTRFQSVRSHEVARIIAESDASCSTPGRICITGYFRKKFRRGPSMTEITAASAWARKNFPMADIIIDVGGQDVKVIDIARNDFRINDKCSAGTGAFLELVAGYFGLDIADMGRISLESKSNPRINSTCSVFALSEIVSLSVESVPLCDILAGVHKACARRIASLVPSGSSPCVMIGGPAMNGGLVSMLSRVLGRPVLVPAKPQMVNAMGAVIHAIEIGAL